MNLYKRPVFLLSASAVAGIVCGLPESGIYVRLFTALLAGFILLSPFFSAIKEIRYPTGHERTGQTLTARKEYSRKKAYKRRYTYHILALSVLLFAAGFIRASCIYRKYSSPLYADFYEYYSPDNEGEFDYALYLKGEGICDEEARKARSEGRLMEVSGSYIERKLFSVREKLSEVIDRVFSEKDAGIIKAVLLGNKTDMDEATGDLYQSAGISHLLSISGLHISIIGMTVLNILKRMKLKKKQALLAASVFSFLYVIMTGSSGSAVRALIMLLFRFFSVYAGVDYDAASALGFSAFTVAMLRPYAVFQSGFQFSFGAAAAICMVSDTVISRTELFRERNSRLKTLELLTARSPVEKDDRRAELYAGRHGQCRYVHRRNRLSGAARTIVTGVCIQLVTLPVLLYSNFRYPLYSSLINLLVVPLMGGVMYSGFAAMLLGLIPVLRKPAVLSGAVGHYILKLYGEVCRLTEKLPLCSICAGRPSVKRIIIYYIILAAGIYISLYSRAAERRAVYCSSNPEGKPGKRINVRTEGNKSSVMLSPFAALSAFAVIAVTVLCIRPRETGKMEICSISCGQGDSTVLIYGDHTVLFDGGSSSEGGYGEMTLVPFLESRGIDRVDSIFISHSDSDHTSGVIYLLENSRVKAGELWLPESGRDSADYEALKNAFSANSPEGNVRYLRNGDTVCLGEGSQVPLIKCIYEGKNSVDANRNSPALIVSYREFSMLLTGDMQEEEEAELCRSAVKRKVTVYKAAHHGSRSSNSEILLDTFDPEYAVISCGRKNRYGHPHEEVVERLEKTCHKVYITPETGEIRFVTDGRTLEISAYRQGTDHKS